MSSQRLRWLVCLGGAGLAFLAAPYEDLSVAAFWAITVAGIAIMAMEMLPIVAVGLLLPATYILCGTASAKVVFTPWLTTVPWIILAGMIIGRLMEKTGLSRRIALHIIAAVGSTPLRLMLALAMTGYVLALLIPDAFTLVVLMVTLTTALCQRLGLEKKTVEAGVLMFAGFFAAMVPQPMIYPNNLGIIAAEMIASTGLTFTWLGFALENLVPTLLMSGVSILVLLPFCTPTLRDHVQQAVALSQADLLRLGPITPLEKRSLLLVVLALIAFIAEPLHGIPGTYAFLFTVLLGFTPVFQVLDEQDLSQVPYGILFFCTGCMSIGFVAEDLGLAQGIAAAAATVLEGMKDPGLLAVCAYVGGFLVNFVLTPLAAVTSLSLPLAELALDMGAGIKPVLYSFLYGLEQVLLPYEAATILFMYATGYVSLRFFALVMALRFLAGGLVIALSGWWLWPLMEL